MVDSTVHVVSKTDCLVFTPRIRNTAIILERREYKIVVFLVTAQLGLFTQRQTVLACGCYYNSNGESTAICYGEGKPAQGQGRF